METRAPFLSCSSHPAVCPSPKEDRLFREAVFMQIAGNDRRTVNTSQSRGANTKLGIHHVHRNPLTLLVMKAAGYMGRVHWETFRASSMENKSLTSRPC